MGTAVCKPDSYAHNVAASALDCSWTVVSVLRAAVAFRQDIPRPTPYLRELSQFEFWHLHSIVFDQLIPAVANYWTHEEVDLLAKNAPLASYGIERPRNGNGWIIQGVR